MSDSHFTNLNPPSFENEPKVFSGVRFDVHQVFLPGKKGQTVKREVVTHPGAVLILPILDQENIVMIQNERFATGKTLWELPAGTLEAQEKPIDTAARELTEETGYSSKNIKPFLSFYTTPGFTNEAMYCFIAKDLFFVGQSLDDNERIIVKIIAFKKALEMIKEGIIIDGKTIAALLYYRCFS